jgi:hypothetical protein
MFYRKVESIEREDVCGRDKWLRLEVFERRELILQEDKT